MKQIEYLISRIVELIEDHPGVMFTITVAVDEKGIPILWGVQEIPTTEGFTGYKLKTIMKADK